MIFKSKETAHKVLGWVFIAGVAVSAALLLVYHWRNSNALVYYVTVRPAWAWFLGAFIILVVGTGGVKGKAAIAGFVIWFICLSHCEEPTSLLRSLRGDPTTAAEATAGQAQEGRLTIATWNISATPQTAEAAVSQLTDLDADLIFLQECSAGEILPLAISKSAYFMQYNFMRAGDNAILSRFPASEVEDSRINENGGHVCSVELLPGVKALCINVHFPPPALTTQLWPAGGWQTVTDGEQQARTRLAYLKNVVDEYAAAGPVIVAGDFNLPGNYAGLRNATKALTDSFLAAGRGWGKTVPAAVPMSRVDIIYLSRHFKPVDCVTVGTFFSDHRPVVTEAEVVTQE